MERNHVIPCIKIKSKIRIQISTLINWLDVGTKRELFYRIMEKTLLEPIESKVSSVCCYFFCQNMIAKNSFTAYKYFSHYYRTYLFCGLGEARHE